MDEHVTIYSDQDLRLLLVQTIIGEGRSMDVSAESVIADAAKLEAYIKEGKKDATEDQA